MILHSALSLIFAVLSLQDIFKEYREYEEFREYAAFDAPTIAEELAIKEVSIAKEELIVQEELPLVEEPFPEFFSEDMIAIQSNREKLVDFVRSFPQSEYSIVETKDAYLYTVEGKFFLESQEVEVLLNRYVKPGSTAIDYGAENGARTLTLSKLVGEKGKVIAFEARPLLFRELFWNLVLNKAANVDLYCTLLTEKENILKSLHLQNISLIRINADGRENIFLKAADEAIKKFHPILILSMIGGIPPERADKFVRQAFQKRIDDIHKMGYTTRRIHTGEYIALPR